MGECEGKVERVAIAEEMARKDSGSVRGEQFVVLLSGENGV